MTNVTFSTVYEVKYLDIFLDTKLLWDKHIRCITANARKLTGLFKRTVSHPSPVKDLKQLYSYIFMLQLEYATPVWNSLSKSQIQTLGRIQIFDTKVMFGYESTLTCPDRIDGLNLLPLLYKRDISDQCQIQIYSQSLLITYAIFSYSDRYNMYKYTLSVNDEDSISSLLWLTSHLCLLEK